MFPLQKCPLSYSTHPNPNVIVVPECVTSPFSNLTTTIIFLEKKKEKEKPTDRPTFFQPCDGNHTYYFFWPKRLKAYTP